MPPARIIDSFIPFLRNDLQKGSELDSALENGFLHGSTMERWKMVARLPHDKKSGSHCNSHHNDVATRHRMPEKPPGGCQWLPLYFLPRSFLTRLPSLLTQQFMGIISLRTILRK
jgi:hypothetical protein